MWNYFLQLRKIRSTEPNHGAIQIETDDSQLSNKQTATTEKYVVPEY